MAFCLAGASRSLPTVPVLKGLKKNVLQSVHYVSYVFAALSLETVSPQPLEYNASLMKAVASPAAVGRSLEHLQPELRAVAYYNTSTALKQWGARSCAETPRAAKAGEDPVATAMGTQVPMLYSAQLCYGLVRAFELQRNDERFDYVVRLRPDHLFLQPLPAALNMSFSRWPSDSVVMPAVGVQDFALAPGKLAAPYFRAFDSAASCAPAPPPGPPSHRPLP